MKTLHSLSCRKAKMPYKKTVLALAIATSISSLSHAEETQQVQDAQQAEKAPQANEVQAAQSAKQLPTVKVEAEADEGYKVTQSTSHKQTQPLLDTAKTITIIPKSVMQDRGVEDVRDALRNVPGISLAAGEGGTPTGDSLSIRGFSARTDILIDGIRDIAGYTRDAYNIEAVEVSKGPGSAVSGRGSTGGSINLQAKSAALDDITEITASYGTENDYRIAVDTNTSITDNSAVRINLLADDGEVAGREEVENSKKAIAVSLASGLETSSRFTLSTEYQKQDNLPDYGLPWVKAGESEYIDELSDDAGGAPSVNYSNFYGNVYRDFEDITAQSVTAKYEYDLSKSTLLRTQARVGSVKRLSIVSAPRFVDLAASTDVRLSHEKTRDTKNSLSVIQFDLIGRYQTANVLHEVVSGFEVAKEKEQRWNLDDNGTDNLDTTPEIVDLYSPNSRVNYLGSYTRDGNSTEAVGDTTAFYIFDTMTFNSNWELTIGARWESFETEYQYSYTDPSKIFKASDDLFSWNTSVVYKPATNGSIYFGIGNSLNPSAEDLTASTRGNENDLDPEETVSMELGTKWELLEGKLLTNFAIFRTEKTNARTDAPDGAFAEDDGRFKTLNGEQRVDGLELSAYGQINKQLSLTAAYTYQDSKVLKAEGSYINRVGQELARTPKHSASIWLNYVFDEQWISGAGVQYSAKRFNSSDALTREIADGYTTFDLMLAYKVSNQMRLQLNATNLLNEKYEDQIGGGHFIPGEARHVRVTASYAF